MEKRMTAKARARQIDRVGHYEGFVHAEFVDLATERIKADRKATLEAAAERFRKVACPLKATPRTVKPETCQRCAEILGPQYCTEVAAILRDEED